MFSSKIREIYYKFELRYFLSSLNVKKWKGYKRQRKCIVCLAADYGNLGDIAITYAQTMFLRQHLKGFEIVDFPISETLSGLKALKRICTSEDVITIVGGGNMGDRYFDIELLRLMIVKRFPQNNCIVFPQTIEYSDNQEAYFLQKLSQKIYSQHPRLLLIAREVTSFQTMQRLYPTVKTLLTPDIVMSLDKRFPLAKRKDITFCLRNDDEAGSEQEKCKELRCLLSHNISVVDYDTHIGASNLSIEERMNALERIWQQFRQSRWVITDRLHGMIFAYITGTPAIVIPNANFKIEKCFEWIKECGYIHFMPQMNVQEALALINKDLRSEFFEETHSKIINSLNQIFLHL